MRNRPWAELEDAELLRRREAGETHKAIAEALGRSKVSVHQRARRLDGRLPTVDMPQAALMPSAARNTDENLQVSETDTASVITARSYTIRDLDGLLAAAKVDLDVWEVERWVANKWDVGSKLRQPDRTHKLSAMELWQVKAWLRRRLAKTYVDAAEGIIERMRQHAPKYPKMPRLAKVKDPHCLFLGLHDHHFG